MAIRVECSSCKQTLEAPDEFAGRVAICPSCRTRVQIPPSPPSQAPPTQASVSATSEIFPQPITAEPSPTKLTPSAAVDRIESIASDIRAELQTLNRRLGCLVVLVVVVAVVGFVGAYVLLHGINQLGQLGQF